MVSLNPNPCQAVAIIISGTWGSGSCSESSFVGFGGGVAVRGRDGRIYLKNKC